MCVHKTSSQSIIVSRLAAKTHLQIWANTGASSYDDIHDDDQSYHTNTGASYDDIHDDDQFHHRNTVASQEDIHDDDQSYHANIEASYDD